jgi:two-component system, sensor histidine kinase and response regulator
MAGDIEPEMQPPVLAGNAGREVERPIRILLAEDNTINQRLATHILEKWGYSVVLAVTGRQAVEAWKAGSFDFILMDLQMPEMDGLEATKAIREQEKTAGNHTPIVAMTAHVMPKDRESCLAAGMDDYLSKPIRTEELHAMIERLTRPDSSQIS